MSDRIEPLKISDPLEQIAQENADLEKQLAQLGKPLALDVVANIRLDVLTQLLLSEPMQHTYTVMLLSTMNSFLRERVSEATRSKLTEGVQVEQPRLV